MRAEYLFLFIVNTIYYMLSQDNVPKNINKINFNKMHRKHNIEYMQKTHKLKQEMFVKHYALKVFFLSQMFCTTQ